MSGREGVPFRWNVARREQLGRLPDAPVQPHSWQTPPRMRLLREWVRDGTVRTVARAGDARWVFVGRSPESLFDYLSGILAETAWLERVDLLAVSMDGLRDAGAEARRALREHLRALDLAPARIASAPLPIAFIDLVASGRTFGALSGFLTGWAREEGVDPAAVRRRLRWVGITSQRKNSPNTWRWFQRAPWAGEYPRAALRGVAIDPMFWGFLGDRQAKTMPSNYFTTWGREEMRHPLHHPEHLVAVRLALALYEKGRAPEERARFAAQLARRPEMREPWLRSLVVALRR